LNPEHSRWLQGYPVVWGYCGATAIRLCRKLRRNSSERPCVGDRAITLPPEKIGDKAQRYEIWCDEEDGALLLIGWSDTPDGFKDAVEAHPAWMNHRAVDRQGEIK